MTASNPHLHSAETEEKLEAQHVHNTSVVEYAQNLFKSGHTSPDELMLIVQD